MGSRNLYREFQPAALRYLTMQAPADGEDVAVRRHRKSEFPPASASPAPLEAGLQRIR
jgi:hypothetical protein